VEKLNEKVELAMNKKRRTVCFDDDRVRSKIPRVFTAEKVF